MTQTVRQNKLFAAEDYTAVYESYVNANFQAYDFDTIRTSMVDYVRENYPENYNDWVESAEFVAILDVVAQLGHNLAYRLDMNTRNNFLSTAQRQESVLKLAEFLGYQPKRNLAASGHIKVTSIKTTETVIGASGDNLSGREVRFETTDADNLDDFITVMNAVLGDNNQFGSPLRQTISSGITTQFYEFNNTPDQIAFDISGRVLGTQTSFNVVGLTYNPDNRVTVEKMPDPAGSLPVIYKNDGKGITSANTGFFFGLKQGTIQFKDVSINEPISNMTVDVDAENINQTDVWVQTINQNGDVVTEWTQVNDIYGNNAIYNTINSGNRNVYSVKTRANNKISVMFPDDSFGNIPKGIVRIWYRVSENNSYVVRPEDIGNTSVSLRYVGADGGIYTVTFGLSLKESITNASAGESMDSIKVNAPRIYATQNRMITAQDYSSYLLSQSENILKIKSINRTHSGHSRYITPNDPTGAYANLHLYGTDGKLYKELVRDEIISTSNISPSRLFDEYVKPALQSSETVSRFYEGLYARMNDIRDNIGYDSSSNSAFLWFGSKTQGSVTTGYFVQRGLESIIKGIGPAGDGYLTQISVGSMIRFVYNDEYRWAKVSNVFNDGYGVNDTSGIPTGKRSLVTGSPGAIALDAVIPEGAVVDLIYTAYPSQITDEERDKFINKLNSGDTQFSMVYNSSDATWEVADVIVPGAVMNVQSVGGDVSVSYFKCRIILESEQQIKFSNLTNQYKIDEESKKRARDVIDVVLFNNGIETKHKFFVYGYVKEDGITDDSKVILVANDANNDNRPDNPNVFIDVFAGLALADIGGVGTKIYANNNAAETVRFEWTHVPDVNEIIDPSFTNIIDVFTLTGKYDTMYREWLVDETDKISEPLPPTMNELNMQFSKIHDKKAMSDKIIYRPVKYKPLFGPKADSSVRASFRVVKVPTSNITDSELKNRIVKVIQDFFHIDNWDFGETFYFTELAGYVHKELPGIVGSFVIVPSEEASVFGDLFQITPASDELFIPDVSISNIDLIDSITQVNIRAV